jgi:uncharacterized FAD-dependent dehydrogenase
MPDVLIIGAGPAGLFAASELIGSGLEVLIIEAGRDVSKRKCPLNTTTKCMKCNPCNIMSGVGGAGGLSDGKLNLRPDIGGNLTDFTGSEEEAWELVDQVDSTFLAHGVPENGYGMGDDAEELRRRAASVGINFIPIRQRHVGSDKLPKVIESMKRWLVSEGIGFKLKCEVTDLLTEDERISGVVIKKGRKTEKIRCSNIVACPGRSGALWFAKEGERLGIKTHHAPVDIGVRVEVRSMVMDPVTRINWDPKFHIYTKTYDDWVRTFCTCPDGYVTKEDYGDFVGVNGHSMIDKKSENTNFAFLTNLTLTEPVEDTTAYASSIARLSTTIGGGKPLIQRLGDLRNGRRSTWARIEKSYVKPTLTDVTPGDISMALPQRLVTDITEGLTKLNEVIPGVASDSTLLYCPELKMYSMRFITDGNMMTSMEGLYVAGDGAGLARGIVGSAATGVLAARGILRRMGLPLRAQ